MRSTSATLAMTLGAALAFGGASGVEAQCTMWCPCKSDCSNPIARASYAEKHCPGELIVWATGRHSHRYRQLTVTARGPRGHGVYLCEDAARRAGMTPINPR
jgi:hypothetical protein